MSIIADRIGRRHDAISTYFKLNKFGDNPEDLTILSLLPPIDRCLILERVMEAGTLDFITCIDKLSMAYYKAGWEDVARAFIDNCDRLGLLNHPLFNRQFFDEKLDGLPVINVSQTYADSLQKLAQYWTGSKFCNLISDLCRNYKGNELLLGTETFEEVAAFKNERENALSLFFGNTNKLYIPNAHSGDSAAFILANTHVIAFSYLLGGASPIGFTFATSNNFNTLDKRACAIWTATEPLVRKHSPYPFAARADAGERAYLVSVELPTFEGADFRYRRSRHRINLDAVVDLMFEIMGIKPRALAVPHLSGELFYRFSWMFLQDDVNRLLSIFPSVVRQYGEWAQMKAVCHDMDRILNSIAHHSLSTYPFMECEFTGW